MLSYEAIFFDDEMVNIIDSLEINPLSKVNDKIHCTFKYHPSSDEIFDEIVGQSFEVYLAGYANDGKNSGFEILLPTELNKYYINFDIEEGVLAKPHITASIAKDAKAANTKKLNFEPLAKPIKVVGKFGYWIKEEDTEYLSFEPYTKIKSK